MRQLKEMLMRCGVNGQKPIDSEVDFILIKIQQTESSMMLSNYISLPTWQQWVELQRNRRYTSLIYLQQHIDVNNMPDDTAEELLEK